MQAAASTSSAVASSVSSSLHKKRIKSRYQPDVPPDLTPLIGFIQATAAPTLTIPTQSVKKAIVLRRSVSPNRQARWRNSVNNANASNGTPGQGTSSSVASPSTSSLVGSAPSVSANQTSTPSATGASQAEAPSSTALASPSQPSQGPRRSSSVTDSRASAAFTSASLYPPSSTSHENFARAAQQHPSTRSFNLAAITAQDPISPQLTHAHAKLSPVIERPPPVPTPGTDLTGSMEKLVMSGTMAETQTYASSNAAADDYFNLAAGLNRGSMANARQSPASMTPPLMLGNVSALTATNLASSASESETQGVTPPPCDVEVDWFNGAFATWSEHSASVAAPARTRKGGRRERGGRTSIDQGNGSGKGSDTTSENGLESVSSGPGSEMELETGEARDVDMTTDGKAWYLRELLEPLVSTDDREDVLHFVLDLVEDGETLDLTGPKLSSSVHVSSGSFTATIACEHVVLVGPPQDAYVPANKRLAVPHYNSYHQQRSDPVFAPLAPSMTAVPMPEVDPYFDLLGQTNMGRLIRSFDWTKTSLGPISTWTPELKTTLSNVLASPFRECILYGPDFVMLYNDPYVTTAQGKHPAILGQPASVGWAELWEGLVSVAQQVRQGETVFVTDHYFAMFRSGSMEETYHTFCYSPFYDARGTVLGIRNFSVETTATVIAARRLSTVRDLIQETSLARTIDDFADSALKSLTLNPFDIPFALLYTVSPEMPKIASKELVRAGAEDKRPQNRHRIKLVGSLGVPSDHVFRVDEIVVDLSPPMSRMSSASGSGSSVTAMDADLPQSRWTWPFEEACLRREPVFVDHLGEAASQLEKRGWDDPPRQAVVVPITVESSASAPQACIVLGVSCRSAYDELYATFFSLVARHIAIGLFTVMTAEIDAKRAEDLLKLDRAKTNFFNNVSHELRTPLTLVLGPLQDLLAAREELRPDQVDKLAMISRHANRLLAMVNKLLDFSSLEGGRMQVKFRPVKLGAMTQDLATLFRDAIERSGLKYIVECDVDRDDLMPMYLAPDLWEKVCYNIIGNALKYCRSGSIEVRLKMTIAEAVLSVKDTGVGIPQSDLASIFERFHRVDGTARTTSGTGIGLALTLEIVKLLGGLVEVESEPGKGSTFHVRIPRGFTHLPREQVSHESESDSAMPPPLGRNLLTMDDAMWYAQDESSAASSSASSVSGVASANGMSSGEDFVDSARLLNLANKTVLLADDSADLRIYISSILAKTFNVVQVADGQAALEYAIKHPPHLIITDQMMPRLNGNELVAAIRSNPELALIPVIMLSAQAGAEARAEALEQGCDDYLVKPFQARELLARVNVHMQLGLLRIELEKRVQERTRALIDSETRNRALAEKFSTLSTVSPVGIIQADAAGTIIYANPRWFEITGHSPDRAVTDSWTDCLEDSRELSEIWTAAVAAGHTSGNIEFKAIEICTKTGVSALFEIRGFSGAKDGFVAVLTDITRQKAIEREHLQIVEQRASDAEENRRNTEAFLDMSSHELRNPLSGVWQNAQVLSTSLESIAGVIDELCSGRLPSRDVLEDVRKEIAENSDAVESILLCASHQGRIADDILNVSKLNMGLLSINPVPFDLTLRLSEVLRMFEVECSQKGINLRMAVDESITRLHASWIVADPSRLSQILLNFVSNSVKFTSDTPERRIIIHLDAYDTRPPTRQNALRVSEPSLDLVAPNNVWITVGVEDTGKGLTQEEMKKLFARFSQANPRSDQYGGSGLGLFVSKQLIALHSGFIEVESQPGLGSIFRFAIPAATASPATEPGASPGLAAVDAIMAVMPPTLRGKRASSSRPTLAREESHKMVKLMDIEPQFPQRILVVEDNFINQKVMTRQLKLAGYAVTVANHGREALDILLAEEKSKHETEGPIAMVLMDIEMPIMTGLQAIRLLREMESTGQLSRRYNVVAVTGNARQTQIEEYSRAGFDDHAVKPYIFADLLVQIRRYVQP